MGDFMSDSLRNGYGGIREAFGSEYALSAGTSV